MYASLVKIKSWETSIRKITFNMSLQQLSVTRCFHLVKEIFKKIRFFYNKFMFFGL